MPRVGGGAAARQSLPRRWRNPRDRPHARPRSAASSYAAFLPIHEPLHAVMALSSLPLSYCTNVHPGRSLAEVERGLDEFTLAVREAYGSPLAAGLWLAAPVVGELLAEPARL